MEHHILWSRCPECTIIRRCLLHAIIVKISNLNFLRSPKPPFMPQDPLVKIFTKLAKNPPLCWESQKIQKVKYYDNFRFICENSRQIHIKTILFSRCIDFSWQFGTYWRTINSFCTLGRGNSDAQCTWNSNPCSIYISAIDSKVRSYNRYDVTYFNK